MRKREAGPDRRGDDETDPTQFDDRGGKSSASASTTPTYAGPVEWSREQARAIDKALDWLDDRNGDQEFRMLGAAGTGKSTVAVEIGKQAGNVAFCALSGKAASRLVERGVERDRCSTIHSLIYYTHYDEDRNRYVFTTKNRSELSHLDLIVVDEASMVGSRVARDLRSFGRPLLNVGDDFQLPPPTGEGDTAPLLAGRADVHLRTIHRQALGNPILAVADAIRRNKDWHRFVDDDRVRVVDFLRVEDAAGYDAVICGTNNRRRAINRKMREHLGYDGAVPHVGEVLICLRNDYEVNTYNGETFEVIKVHRRRDCPAVDLELSNLQYPAKASVTVPLSFFEDGEPPERRTVPHPWQCFDFAYGMTCHKAQASEWDSVAVVDESRVFRDMARRWFYTACTRARKRLTIVRKGVR
ncbi:MAG: ATP-dependent RecD-like DNA helicase [Xanthobacteraceae bacterium]